MYNYDVKSLLGELEEIFANNLTKEEIKWIKDQSLTFSVNGEKSAFFKSFTITPRFVKKKVIAISSEQQKNICTVRKDLNLSIVSADTLTRIWFLLKFPADQKEHYLSAIDQLFPSAEMNELIALYTALPVLAYSEEWKFRCTDGIRSNIGSALESLICNNPYPSEYLDEAAWNQLVLKAFFTDKPVNEIIGLDERANQKLADTLSDYAHERWAAGRIINPVLWRLVGPFLNPSLFKDIEKLFNDGNSIERKAAALACTQSNFSPAKELLNNEPQLRLSIEKGDLNWDSITDVKE